MSTRFLIVGPDEAETTILLAHGAGAPMDSSTMNAAAQSLADLGFRVARFEFGYMAERRLGVTRPPPRAETLNPEYIAAAQEITFRGSLIIGGKSMGGRVATMVADELWSDRRIAGVLCLGYPFHPPGKPDQLRTGHLEELKTPTLIVQGTRDPFGTPEEIAGYKLSKSIEFLFLEDGDHDLKPRKRTSGFSASDHLASMALAVKQWTKRLRQSPRAST
jgi:predicted alpha/beta-hydrolase family hydrolase